MNLAYPYAIDGTGHTAQTDILSHIRDMIEEILFTSPGERVNRPTFGTGTAHSASTPLATSVGDRHDAREPPMVRPDRDGNAHVGS